MWSPLNALDSTSFSAGADVKQCRYQPPALGHRLVSVFGYLNVCALPADYIELRAETQPGMGPSAPS